MSILKHVPKGFKLRDLQTDMLLDIEAAWDSYDVVVLEADVGSGKSLVLQTIAKWQASKEKRSATVTPRVAPSTVLSLVREIVTLGLFRFEIRVPSRCYRLSKHSTQSSRLLLRIPNSTNPGLDV